MKSFLHFWCAAFAALRWALLKLWGAWGKPVLACTAIALVCTVVACGGGSQTAGGVGSGGSGVAEGAVSGFGSVIVAGVEYDDSNASVLLENAQGQSEVGEVGEVAEVKLGQRVRILHSQAGVADSIQILPQLRGSSASAQDAQGVFQLLGQTVQITRSSDTQNTATVLDGLSAVALGDALEVHGHWVVDSARGHSVLIATRIEKLSATPDPVLLSGVVRARSGRVLTVDNAQGTTLQSNNLPSGLGAQSLFTAWLSASALRNSPMVASRVVDASPSLAENQHLVLNTQVSQNNAAPGYVQVQGMRVKLPQNSSAPAVGATVQMDIVHTGSGYQAVTLKGRGNGNDLGGTVELKGSVLWPADPTRLYVRGQAVTVPSSVLSPACAGLQTNDRVYLSIQAQRSNTSASLRASSVACSVQIPSSSVVEVAGTLTQFNLASKTLQVNTRSGLLNLVWNRNSLLPRNLSEWLNRRVEVEYQTINGENRLRKLHPDH